MYEVGARGHDHRHAHSLLDAQMSAPVSTALAMMYGDVTVNTYEHGNLEHAEVQRLIGVTTAGCRCRMRAHLSGTPFPAWRKSR
jgi:hypothetical protein